MSNYLVLTHSQGVDPDGPNRRMAMLTRNREAIEAHIAHRLDKDVVYFVLDCTSCTLSKELAKRFDANGTWTRPMQQVEGTLSTLVGSMPRWQAYKFLRQIQQTLHKIDHRDPKESPVVEELHVPAPAGQFCVIAISRGKQLVKWPLPL